MPEVPRLIGTTFGSIRLRPVIRATARSSFRCREDASVADLFEARHVRRVEFLLKFFHQRGSGGIPSAPLLDHRRAPEDRRVVPLFVRKKGVAGIDEWQLAFD